MDHFFEDSSGDRQFTVGDYLRGYKPSSKSTFDLDQQFARPIEDEDLFGLDDQLDTTKDQERDPIESLSNDSNRLNFDEAPFEGIGSSLLGDEGNDTPGRIFEDESSTIKSPPPVLKPAQLEAARFREKIAEQAKTMKLKPKLGSGFNGNKSIEIIIDETPKSDPSSHLMFDKILNKSKKNNGSPELDKESRVAHTEFLRKKISTQKRKIWDSFQQPVDNFDDEEEFIEPADEQEAPSDSEDQSAPNDSDESDDENRSPDDRTSLSGGQQEAIDNPLGSADSEDEIGAFEIENESCE